MLLPTSLPSLLLSFLLLATTTSAQSLASITAGCPKLTNTAPSPLAVLTGKPKDCADPEKVDLTRTNGTLRDNDCLVGGIMGGDFFAPCSNPMTLRGTLGILIGGGSPDYGDFSGGTGPYKAQYTTDASLPFHTIYAPVDGPAASRALSAASTTTTTTTTTTAGKGKLRGLPLLVWANGACEGDGAAFSNFLVEIASHGFVVIANGAPSVPWGTRRGSGGSGSGGAGGGEKTRAVMLTRAIDWALNATTYPAARYGALDTARVGVAGQSCGGVEAYSATVLDERVKVLGIFNTGVVDAGRRAWLRKLKAPIGYFQGGESDFAHTDMELDYRQIPESLPAMMSSLDVGHGGTYSEKNGGRFGIAATAFFKWTLQDDAGGKDLFFNTSSRLYKDGWKIRTEHWH